MPAGVVTKKLHDEAAAMWGRCVRGGCAYRNIGQAELARLMGYKSAQTVSYWWHGKRLATLPIMVKMAIVLKIPLHQLVFLGAVDYDNGESAPGSVPKTMF